MNLQDCHFQVCCNAVISRIEVHAEDTISIVGCDIADN